MDVQDKGIAEYYVTRLKCHTYIFPVCLPFKLILAASLLLRSSSEMSPSFTGSFKLLLHPLAFLQFFLHPCLCLALSSSPLTSLLLATLSWLSVGLLDSLGPLSVNSFVLGFLLPPFALPCLERPFRLSSGAIVLIILYFHTILCNPWSLPPSLYIRHFKQNFLCARLKRGEISRRRIRVAEINRADRRNSMKNRRGSFLSLPRSVPSID